MRTWLARRIVLVLAVVAMCAIGGSVVLAAIPSSGGTIYACYSKTTGAMRVVNYPTLRCASTERLLSWTQVGPKAPPLSSIGIATLGPIDGNFWESTEAGSGLTVLSVWAETGSAKTACLATMNESRNGVAVNDLYCSSRHVKLEDGNWHDGVYLHLFLAAPLPAGSAYWVNVYQEGARSYSAPRKCDMEGCNQ